MPTKSPLAQESKATNTKHAVWLRRRGAKTTENSLKLTGLDIYFEMPRIRAAGSLNQEILHVGT